MSQRHGWIAYQNNELLIEGHSPERLASEFGTPLFVYSAETIRSNFRRIKSAFSAANPLIAYSVKANTNGAIIRLLAKEGAGFDVVSGNELQRVLDAGVSGNRIIFAGVGKTAAEMRLALKSGVREFNVESPAEAVRLNSVALELGVQAPVCIRINPEVDAKTHQYITTGKKENKFGMSLEAAHKLAREVGKLPGLRLDGLHAHIGSQILQTVPHHEAVAVVDQFIGELKADGVLLKTLNFGGGFGIAYEEGQKPLDLEPVANAVVPLAKKYGLELFLEPGRSIIAPAGLFLTRVEYIKHGKSYPFVIIDGAMTEMLRPALYQAYHEIYPVKKRDGEKVAVDVVGPVCESGDFIAKQRPMILPEAGDLLVVMDAGAYCSAMSSNYNSRQRPAEILLDGHEVYIIRQRETFEDLYRHEVVPDYLA
ncbi:MAG: diaminopimelate decarboxylase [Candidatus Sumerlaeia bacterium]|nr:diaminopimelate decarboxylase [Candidatus Sumerlaeia bacterium]